MALQFVELVRCASTIIGHQLKLCAIVRTGYSSGNHLKSYSPFPPLRNFNSSSCGTGVRRPGGSVPVDASGQKAQTKQQRYKIKVLGSKSVPSAPSATNFQNQRFEQHVRGQGYSQPGKQRPGVPRIKDIEREETDRLKSLSSNNLQGYIKKQEENLDTDGFSDYPKKSTWQKKENMKRDYRIGADMFSDVNSMNGIGAKNAESERNFSVAGKGKNRFEADMEENNGDISNSKKSKWKTSVKDSHHRGYSNVPVSNQARDVGEWLLAVREHMAKMEKEAKCKTQRHSNSVPNKIKLNDKDTTPVSGSLAINSTLGKSAQDDSGVQMRTTPRSESKNLHSSNANKYLLDGDKAMTRNLEKINDELDRFRKEKNPGRDSTKSQREKTVERTPEESEELLEIQPSFVENIEGYSKEPVPSKDDPGKNQTVRSKTLDSFGQEKRRNAATENGPSNSEIRPSIQGKSFILLEEQSRNLTVNNTLSHNRPDRSSFIIWNDEKCQRSVLGNTSHGKKNILLENDNPHIKHEMEKTAPEEQIKQFISLKQPIGPVGSNVSLSVMDDGIFGSVASDEKKRTSDDQTRTMKEKQIGSSRGNIPEQDGDTSEPDKSPLYWKPQDSRRQRLNTSTLQFEDNFNMVKSKKDEIIKKNNDLQGEKKLVKDSPPAVKKTGSATSMMFSSGKNGSGKPLAAASAGFKKRKTTSEFENQENPNGSATSLRQYTKPMTDKLRRSMNIINMANVDYTKGASTFVKPLSSCVGHGFADEKIRNNHDRSSSWKSPASNGKPDENVKRNAKKAQNFIPVIERDIADLKKKIKKNGKLKSAKRSTSFPSSQGLASTKAMETTSGEASKIFSEANAKPCDVPDIGDHEMWSKKLLDKMTEYQKFATMEVKETENKSAPQGSLTTTRNDEDKKLLKTAGDAKKTKSPSKIFPKGKKFTNKSKETAIDSGLERLRGESHKAVLEKSLRKDHLSRGLDGRNPSITVRSLVYDTEKYKPKQNRKLIEELRKQWSESFKEKYLTMQKDKLLKSIKYFASSKNENLENKKFIPDFQHQPRLQGSKSKNRPANVPSVPLPKSSDYTKWLDDPDKLSKDKSPPRPTHNRNTSPSPSRVGVKRHAHVSRKAEKTKVKNQSKIKDPFDEWIQSRDHIMGQFFGEDGVQTLNSNSNKAVSAPGNNENSPVDKIINTPSTEVKDSSTHSKSFETPNRSSTPSTWKKQYPVSDKAVKPQEKSPLLETNSKTHAIAPLIYKDIRETYLRSALKNHNQSTDNKKSETFSSKKSQSSTELQADSKKPKLDFSDGHQRNVNEIYDNIMKADTILSQLQRLSASKTESNPKTVDQTSKKLKTTSRTSLSKSFPAIPAGFMDSFDGVMGMTIIEEPPDTKASLNSPKYNTRRGSSLGHGEGKHVCFRDEQSNNWVTKEMSKNDWLDLDTPLLDMPVPKQRLDTAEEFSNIGYPERDLRESLAEQRRQSAIDAKNDLIKGYQKNIQKYEAALEKYRAKLRTAQLEGRLLLKNQGDRQEKSTEL